MKGADPELLDELTQEIGIVSWSELERHFARGSVILVDEHLDLIHVANCMIQDDTMQIKRWLDANQLLLAIDGLALGWSSSEISFEAMVVAPWVLVKTRDMA